MSDILITGSRADRLLALAEEKQQTVEELLDTFIEEQLHSSGVVEATDDLNPLQRILEVIDSDPSIWEFEDTNLAANSRDILNREFADYLQDRLKRNAGTDERKNTDTDR